MESPRYKHGDIQVLVPEAYGDELAQQRTSSTRTTQTWTVDDYFLALAADSPLRPIVQRLLNWADARQLTIRMGHGQTPAPMWRLDAQGVDYPLFSVDIGGKLWLSLGNLRGRLGADGEGVVRALIEAINAIPGINVAPGSSGPAVPLLPLARDETSAAFTAAYDSVIDVVRAAESRG